MKRITEILACFDTATRDNGRTYCWLNDTKAEWMEDLVRSAHDGMLPDDHRYEIIRDCLSALAEDFDDPYLEPEHRLYSLADWLTSHGRRSGYCDDALAETRFNSVSDLLMSGYRKEQEEVLSLLRHGLEELEEGDNNDGN